jgi:hypothetical protein
MHGDVNDTNDLFWEPDNNTPQAAASAAAAVAAVTLPTYFTSDAHADAAKAAGKATRDALLKPGGEPTESAFLAARNLEKDLMELKTLETLITNDPSVCSNTQRVMEATLALVQRMGDMLQRMPRQPAQQQRYRSFVKTGPIDKAALLPAIPVVGYRHESLLLIEAGVMKPARFNKSKRITRPPCCNGDSCEGMKGGIRGFVERTPITPEEKRMGRGMTMMMWMSEDELMRLETYGTQPILDKPRSCLYCMRYLISELSNNIAQPDMTDEKVEAEKQKKTPGLHPLCILQPFGNRENCADGYLRSACIMPSSKPFNGITRPIVRFSKDHYVARYDPVLDARVLDQDAIRFDTSDQRSTFIQRAASDLGPESGIDAAKKALAMASELARVRNFPK